MLKIQLRFIRLFRIFPLSLERLCATTLARYKKEMVLKSICRYDKSMLKTDMKRRNILFMSGLREFEYLIAWLQFCFELDDSGKLGREKSKKSLYIEYR